MRDPKRPADEPNAGALMDWLETDASPDRPPTFEETSAYLHGTATEDEADLVEFRSRFSPEARRDFLAMKSFHDNTDWNALEVKLAAPQVEVASRASKFSWLKFAPWAISGVCALALGILLMRPADDQPIAMGPGSSRTATADLEARIEILRLALPSVNTDLTSRPKGELIELTEPVSTAGISKSPVLVWGGSGVAGGQLSLNAVGSSRPILQKPLTDQMAHLDLGEQGITLQPGIYEWSISDQKGARVALARFRVLGDTESALLNGMPESADPLTIALEAARMGAFDFALQVMEDVPKDDKSAQSIKSIISTKRQSLINK